MAPIPNEPGKGYFDLDETLKIKKKIASWGMEINRVSLSYLSKNYVKDGDGSEDELEDCWQSLRVVGKAKLPLGRVGFANDVYQWMQEPQNGGGVPALCNNTMPRTGGELRRSSCRSRLRAGGWASGGARSFLRLDGLRV